MTSTNGIAQWKEIVRERRAKQLEQIPTAWLLSPAQKDSSKNVRKIIHSCGILSPKELELTDMTDVRPLLKKLASGDISSLEVTMAFCKRAAIAQQVTNCLTEIFFEQALRRANELDVHLLTHNRETVGPLHGLPVSVKDRFDIEGFDTTVGMCFSSLHLAMRSEMNRMANCCCRLDWLGWKACKDFGCHRSATS
jgi:amidase